MRLRAIFLNFFLCSARVAAAQGAPETGGFVVRLGTDTVVVERFTRTADRVEGEYLARSPRTVLRRWTATLAPEGTVRGFEMTSQPVAEAGAAPLRVSYEFTGDRAGIHPFLNNSWALLELATRRFRAGAAARLAQPALPPGDEELMTLTLERRGDDSVTLTIFEGNPNAVRVDATGRILGVRGFGQLTVERVSSLDIAALAASFGPRPLGALSPRDTARAEIAGAQVVVDYSRPARRGRTVFGGIVLWDRVWRTGANTATTLITDADLVIGGATVPAGRYSLYTVPRPSDWTLIINRDVGQSGTEYNVERDLARVTMSVETLPQLVERFTITIEPRGTGGVLSFAWERTRASIAFSRK
ncbi:MAG: DUF2911 domain-containing protein [Gemmatimonadetes bacterium]|nr:DUF2911 domain-containing protein [Gemmatimonadota bacterium]